MYLILALLLSSASFATTLKFPQSNDWELREKFFGWDYALVERNSSSPDSVLIRKMPQTISPPYVEKHLRQLIADKKSSRSPWKDIQIKRVEEISWVKGLKGTVMKVEHTKKSVPHISYVGVMPLKEGHFFFFYSIESLKFGKDEEKLLKFLKSIRGT